jgi:aspartyl-tRNA synthetase
MVADRPSVVHAALGAVRNHLGRVRRLYDDERLEMLWVTEFPMFERSDETGEISAAHHPFTMIHADDLDKLESDPLAVRSRAYDLVVNGREIGSGSIRITEAHRKFGFLLEAFEYGVPPHGGWAGGIDRMIMEGVGTDNIRDVIAFPKTQQAQEPMTDAPAPVDAAQLLDLGVAILPVTRTP